MNIFAASRKFKRPSDLWAAYHETFAEVGPASRHLAAAGYSRTCDNTHVKFWAKIKYVIYNIYAHVKQDAEWTGELGGTTGDGSDVQDRQLLRNRLSVTLGQADYEFLKWACSAGSGRSLLQWCQKRETPFTQMTISEPWAGRLWPDESAE